MQLKEKNDGQDWHNEQRSQRDHDWFDEQSENTKGASTLNPDSNRFSNRIAQCESQAHRSRPHCAVQNRIHACMLTSSGHSSVHDARVFTNSTLNNQLKNGDIFWCLKVIVDGEHPVHVCILGDPAYSLLPYLMKECANEGSNDQNSILATGYLVLKTSLSALLKD